MVGTGVAAAIADCVVSWNYALGFQKIWAQ